jgi:hypothetical protein
MAKTTKNAKTRGKNRGLKKATPKRKAGAARASARKTARKRRTAAKASASKARRKKAAPARSTKQTSTRTKARSGTRKAKARKTTARKTARPAARKAAKTSSRPRRAGSQGREATLAQTPEAGRTVKGRTNPMPTRRSTGTPAGAGSTRHAPGLDRERKQLRELEETVEGPPSSLDLDRHPSAARSGRRHLQDALDDHPETGPVMTGGDIDADWEDAYAVGDEAPGGDNPTPDQDRVDDIGRALGIEYQDNEELKGADKIAERDRHRWELDPASSDDYRDRD